MRTFFIINPTAGNGKGDKDFADNILSQAKALGMEGKVEVYSTNGVGDGEFLTAQILRERKSGETYRFIACGGDGTLNEVLNGIMQFENVELGVMPIGTGNDFCRNFTDVGDFLSAKAQLLGKTIKCDAIEYTGEYEGLGDDMGKGMALRTRYCANMFNIGFDCHVVDATALIKKTPGISGSAAYVGGVLQTLIKKKGADLRIELDGKEVASGFMLFTNFGNGQYCGGGVHSTPTADLHDGKMHINIVKDISRTRMMTLFPHYKKGEHINMPNLSDILIYTDATEAKITPLNGVMRLCTDGENVDSKEITLKVIPDAFDLVIPAK